MAGTPRRAVLDLRRSVKPNLGATELKQEPPGSPVPPALSERRMEALRGRSKGRDRKQMDCGYEGAASREEGF